MYYVYIAYQPQKQKYRIGVTNSLERRKHLLFQLHSRDIRIVHYEEYSDSAMANKREDELMEMKDEVIKALVMQNNPMHTDILTFK